MKKVIFVFLTVFVLSCSAIKTRSIANDIVNNTDRVATVCSAVALFEAVGMTAPGADVCADAVRVINSDAYRTIYDVANCARRHEVESRDFRFCVSAVDGWESVAKKLGGK